MSPFQRENQLVQTPKKEVKMRAQGKLKVCLLMILELMIQAANK